MEYVVIFTKRDASFTKSYKINSNYDLGYVCGNIQSMIDRDWKAKSLCQA